MGRLSLPYTRWREELVSDHRSDVGLDVASATCQLCTETCHVTPGKARGFRALAPAPAPAWTPSSPSLLSASCSILTSCRQLLIRVDSVPEVALAGRRLVCCCCREIALIQFSPRVEPSGGRRVPRAPCCKLRPSLLVSKYPPASPLKNHVRCPSCLKQPLKNEKYLHPCPNPPWELGAPAPRG